MRVYKTFWNWKPMWSRLPGHAGQCQGIYEDLHARRQEQSLLELTIHSIEPDGCSKF